MYVIFLSILAGPIRIYVELLSRSQCVNFIDEYDGRSGTPLSTVS